MTKRTEPIPLASGCLVINTSTASGGVTYDRTVITDDSRHQRRTISIRQIKQVDSERIVKEIDAAVKDVDHVLRDLCARIPDVGHFAAATVVNKVHGRVAEIAQRVDRMNAEAIRLGSNHRGVARVVTAFLDRDRAENCRAVYRAIHDVLREVHEALRLGDVVDEPGPLGSILRRNQLRPILLRTKNLETLVAGPTSLAIDNALTRAKTARTELLELIRGGEAPADAGTGVDLTAIETAIARFADLVD